MPWAEFTQGKDNTPILVNVAAAEIAVRSGSGTCFYFSPAAQEPCQVNESLDRVKEIITEAEGF